MTMMTIITYLGGRNHKQRFPRLLPRSCRPFIFNSPGGLLAALVLVLFTQLSTISSIPSVVLGDKQEFSREYELLYDVTLDKESLESIRALHEQLDDDNDGTIEPSETGDFIKADLQYGDDKQRVTREKRFHNKDAEITVKDLWITWSQSEVYNWTTNQVVDWVVKNVELPQYEKNIRKAGLNGTHLPKAAVSTSFLLKVVGVSSPIHRSKFTLKAMDIVLFGPPRDNSNWLKDAVLTSLLVIAVTGLFYAYQQNKKSREHLNRMMQDMDSLSKAENTLKELQEKLHQKDSKIESLSSTPSEVPDAVEVSRLKEELEILRSELHRAELELEDKCWMAPPVLQNWLQLTYELESQTYNAKRKAAEEQLELAKDMCERLKRKRSSLVGAFVSTHGRSIDDVDRSILEARTALLELTKDLTERSQRWRQIEMLCGCSIVNNPGIPVLQSLVRHVGQGRYGNRAGLSSRMSSNISQDDLQCSDDFDAHSVAASHLTVASSHISRPSASLLSSAVHHHVATSSAAMASVASSVSGHTRRKEEPKSRESSKESSSDELERPSNTILNLPVELQQQFIAGSSARSSTNSNHRGLLASTPPVNRSSTAAFKRGKMMQKSLSQDAGGSIQQHVLGTSATPGVSVSSSISDGHLQASASSAVGDANNPTATVKAIASASTSSMPSSSSSASMKGSVSSASGLHLSLSKPSIVEELEESCSASDTGSMNDLESKDKKKKRSFFNFRRKKEKKSELQM